MGMENTYGTANELIKYLVIIHLLTLKQCSVPVSSICTPPVAKVSLYNSKKLRITANSLPTWFQTSNEVQ